MAEERSLLRRVADWFAPVPEEERQFGSLSMQQWVDYFNYAGNRYPLLPMSTLTGSPQESPDPSFEGYTHFGFRSNSVIFSCLMVRMLVFSEARFQFQQMRQGKTGDLFGTAALTPLEEPWQNATTGDLLTRAIQDADLAGNAYLVRNGTRIRRLRPDWVTIVIGSDTMDENEAFALDAEVIGYIYKPGGVRADTQPIVLLPEQVAHFAPIPDPAARFRGMSWMASIVREVMSDSAAMDHKLKFFENGAISNAIVTFDPEVRKDNFNTWVELFRNQHEGIANAYRTLYFGGGAKYEVVGSDFQQMDFKVVQGHGETRIAAAAGVPPILVGLSEGLESATYSNYALARRRFADGTLRPLWRNICGSLAHLVEVPGGARLWYDDRDIPFLKEDIKDSSEIQSTQAQSIKTLIDAGFEPESAIAAITSGDLTRLSHTGLFSVQLQPPGSEQLALEPAPPNGTPAPIGQT